MFYICLNKNKNMEGCKKLVSLKNKLPKTINRLRVLSFSKSKEVIKLLGNGSLSTKGLFEKGKFNFYSEASNAVSVLRKAGFVIYDGEYKRVGGRGSMLGTPHMLNVAEINRISKIVKDFNQL
jgi:hypothetical protein